MSRGCPWRNWPPLDSAWPAPVQVSRIPENDGKRLPTPEIPDCGRVMRDGLTGYTYLPCGGRLRSSDHAAISLPEHPRLFAAIVRSEAQRTRRARHRTCLPAGASKEARQRAYALKTDAADHQSLVDGTPRSTITYGVHRQDRLRDEDESERSALWRPAQGVHAPLRLTSDHWRLARRIQDTPAW